MAARAERQDQKSTTAGQGSAGAGPQAAAPAVAGAKNPQQAYLWDVQRKSDGQGEETGDEGAEAKDAAEAPPPPDKRGLDAYEATLGRHLGPRLYEAVADAITLDKVHGYAQGALDAAIERVVAAVGDAAGPEFDAKAAQAFEQALTQALSPFVDQFMSGPGQELTAALRSWVDASPRAVAVVAVLAAVGAIAANAMVPRIRQRIRIRPGLEAQVEASLGRFHDLSLEQIKAQLEAHGEFGGARVKARLEYVHDKVEGDSYRGSIRFQAPDGRWIAGLAATHDDSGESLDAFIERNWPDDQLAIELRGRMHEELGSQVTLGIKWKF